MSIVEGLGWLLIGYMALIGLAAHIYFAWQGKVRIQGHLDLGRIEESGAVGEHLNLRAQHNRLVPR